FSSRRRHTRFSRDWSSDVCSSDLLINKGIDFNNLLETDYYDKGKTKPKNNELSKTIIDSSWFFLSWKRDPTIKSMLTMLDAFQRSEERRVGKESGYEWSHNLLKEI